MSDAIIYCEDIRRLSCYERVSKPFVDISDKNIFVLMSGLKFWSDKNLGSSNFSVKDVKINEQISNWDEVEFGTRLQRKENDGYSKFRE